MDDALITPRKRKKVVLLGSTGSIGRSTLEVARLLPERIELVGLAANGSVEALAAQVRETGVKHVALHDASRVAELRALLPAGVEILAGPAGLAELATLEGADMVLVAIVGTAGLQPALAAIEAGKDLAVASKEILVMAGEIVTAAAARKGVRLLPVDSEHNAIFQCLDGHRGGGREVSRLVLTASGGPFRTWPAGRLAGGLRPLDFGQLAKLEFEEPRHADFPALGLAREAGLTGGTLPAVFNAANEVAVEAFVAGAIRFPDIWRVVGETMGRHEVAAASSLAAVIDADGWARRMARVACGD